MKASVIYKDLGIIDYKKCWDYQEELFNTALAIKNLPGTQKKPQNYLLFCEHPPVYTLGKSGKTENLLIQEEKIKSLGAQFYKINRGGDITFHGPGQLVIYPIFDLDQFNLTIRRYIFLLEETIIQFLKQKYNIEANRLAGATGIWIEPEKTKKICAIGVRASRNITMHGLAFNITTNLAYFNYINPCGFTDKGVTSLALLTNQKHIDMITIKKQLYLKMQEMFGF